MVKVEHEKVDLLVEQEPPQPPPKEEPQKKSRRRELWKWTKFGEKSGWDWMELLIIPLVLALGGLLFSLAQDTRQQEIEERRAQAQRAAEEQRAQDGRYRRISKGWEAYSLMKTYVAQRQTMR